MGIADEPSVEKSASKTPITPTQQSTSDSPQDAIVNATSDTVIMNASSRLEIDTSNHVDSEV